MSFSSLHRSCGVTHVSALLRRGFGLVMVTGRGSARGCVTPGDRYNEGVGEAVEGTHYQLFERHGVSGGAQFRERNNDVQPNWEIRFPTDGQSPNCPNPSRWRGASSRLTAIDTSSGSRVPRCQSPERARLFGSSRTFRIPRKTARRLSASIRVTARSPYSARHKFQA